MKIVRYLLTMLVLAVFTLPAWASGPNYAYGPVEDFGSGGGATRVMTPSTAPTVATVPNYAYSPVEDFGINGRTAGAQIASGVTEWNGGPDYAYSPVEDFGNKGATNMQPLMTKTLHRPMAARWRIEEKLTSIPKEKRQASNADHQLAIIVKNARGMGISDATVSFEVLQRGKVVTKGEALYQANAATGKRTIAGRYIADITLPRRGLYKVDVSVMENGKVHKASENLFAAR